jgi:hypothetical protein
VALERSARARRWAAAGIALGLASVVGCTAIVGIEPLSLEPDDAASMGDAVADGTDATADRTTIVDGPVTDTSMTDAATDAVATPSDAAAEAEPHIPGCIDRPSKLVRWFRGEDNPFDSVVGDAGNGAWVGNPKYAHGRVGDGFSFSNGVEYVAADLTIDGGFTVDLWAYFEPTTAPPVYALLSTSDSSNDSSGARLEQIGALYDLDYADGGTVSARGEADAGWTHLAVRFDGHALALYRNGVFQIMGAGSAAVTELFFGADGSGPGARWSGVLDEIHVFNRALDDSEIANIADAGAGLCP